MQSSKKLTPLSLPCSPIYCLVHLGDVFCKLSRPHLLCKHQCLCCVLPLALFSGAINYSSINRLHLWLPLGRYVHKEPQPATLPPCERTVQLRGGVRIPIFFTVQIQNKALPVTLKPALSLCENTLKARRNFSDTNQTGWIISCHG